MSELFLEFFTEEMPSGLQRNIRENLLNLFKENLEKNDINYKSAISYSTPNRLVIYIEGIPKKIKQKGLKIKGPNINSPAKALEGFLRSNNIITRSLEFFGLPNHLRVTIGKGKDMEIFLEVLKGFIK